MLLRQRSLGLVDCVLLLAKSLGFIFSIDWNLPSYQKIYKIKQIFQMVRQLLGSPQIFKNT